MYASYMMKREPQLENRVGAWALAVADRLRAETEAAAGFGAAAPAALTTLLMAPGYTIEQLRRSLALTHSGAVRLVDRLESDGLVQRNVGADRRAVELMLTRAGRDVASEVLTARARLTEELLQPLTNAERAMLKPLVDKLLEHTLDVADDVHVICRLCDWPLCLADPPCPTAKAATALRGA
jgi:DNA-binding MarR family transcriptional regulator